MIRVGLLSFRRMDFVRLRRFLWVFPLARPTLRRSRFGMRSSKSITCKICDTGHLRPTTRYRLGGVVALIGYLVLVPSILGMFLGGATCAGSAMTDTDRATKVFAETHTRLVAAGMPSAAADLLLKMDEPTRRDAISLIEDPTMRAEVAELARTHEVARSASSFATGVGAVAGTGTLVMSFVGGLLGWLLVMKKRLLQCSHCGATVAAS